MSCESLDPVYNRLVKGVASRNTPRNVGKADTEAGIGVLMNEGNVAHALSLDRASLSIERTHGLDGNVLVWVWDGWVWDRHLSFDGRMPKMVMITPNLDETPTRLFDKSYQLPTVRSISKPSCKIIHMMRGYNLNGCSGKSA